MAVVYFAFFAGSKPLASNLEFSASTATTIEIDIGFTRVDASVREQSMGTFRDSRLSIMRSKELQSSCRVLAKSRSCYGGSLVVKMSF